MASMYPSSYRCTLDVAKESRSLGQSHLAIALCSTLNASCA